LQKERSCKVCAYTGCASQPESDGGLMVAEDPFSGGRIETFGECRQHRCDLMRRSFQVVQGGVASSSESSVTGRTSKGLDLLSATMLAVPKKTHECEHL